MYVYHKQFENDDKERGLETPGNKHKLSMCMRAEDRWDGMLGSSGKILTK